MNSPKISVLMLTHNAPEFVNLAIRSVAAKTVGVDYELVVVDNASSEETRSLVTQLHGEGLIDSLTLLDYNSLFAEGNNVAAAAASADATHFLLLNSDVEIKDPDWLSRLLAVHERGITTYGVAEDPLRVDGYCLLIDADVYRTHPLDEGHQWWWSVTKQQAAVLTEGLPVKGFGEHERYLHHFGGRSGSAFKSARGMDVTREEAAAWFNGKEPAVIDRTPAGVIPGREKKSFFTRARNRVAREYKLRASRKALR